MDKSKSNQMKLTCALFAVYLLALVWIVLFKFQFSFDTMPHFRGLNLIPFAGSVVKGNRLDYNEIILNLIVFIPFGLYLSMVKPNWLFWKRVVLIAGVSLIFELLQYIFAIGGTDITDLMSNTLGGVVGVGLYAIIFKILKEKTNKVLNIVTLVGTIGIVILGIVVSRFITFRF